MRAHPAEFHLAFSRALGRVIAHVHGVLDADTAPELNDRLVDIIDGQGNRHVIVDLSATTYVDSTGLSVLLAALRRMEENGGEIMLSGPTGDVARAFKAAGLEKVFAFTPAWSHPVHGPARATMSKPGSGDHAG